MFKLTVVFLILLIQFNAVSASRLERREVDCESMMTPTPVPIMEDCETTSHDIDPTLVIPYPPFEIPCEIIEPHVETPTTEECESTTTTEYQTPTPTSQKCTGNSDFVSGNVTSVSVDVGTDGESSNGSDQHVSADMTELLTVAQTSNAHTNQMSLLFLSTIVLILF
jgi:hypothetical protein